MMYNNYNEENNDPFDENSELDRMARNVNNDRSKIKNQTIDDYDTRYSKLQNGVKFLEDKYPSFMPSTSIPSTGFFSTQGNYKETDLHQEDNFVDLYDENDSIFSYSDASSILDMISSEGAVSISPKIKKKLKSNNNHLKNLDNDDNFIEHLRTCVQCKKKIIELITNHNEEDDKILELLHKKTKKINSNDLTKSINSNDLTKSINTIIPEENNSIWKSTSVRDIICVIIFGVVIIIVLDLVMG